MAEGIAVVGSTVRVTLGGFVALGLPPQPTTTKATSTPAKLSPILRRSRWLSPTRLARSPLIVCLPPLTGPSLDTARAKDACCSGFVPPKSPSRRRHFPLRAPEIHRLLRLTSSFARRPTGPLARQRWLAPDRATASSTRFQAPRLSPIRRTVWATPWLNSDGIRISTHNARRRDPAWGGRPTIAVRRCATHPGGHVSTRCGLPFSGCVSRPQDWGRASMAPNLQGSGPTDTPPPSTHPRAGC